MLKALALGAKAVLIGRPYAWALGADGEAGVKKVIELLRAELLNAMIYYGISAISLAITGSERLEGIRACVSLVQRDQFPDLEHRLRIFRENHPQ